jgi:hypothetical protein
MTNAETIEALDQRVECFEKFRERLEQQYSARRKKLRSSSSKTLAFYILRISPSDNVLRKFEKLEIREITYGFNIKSLL